MKYRREIDGLRAFAVLSVVVFHAFPSFLKGGFIGVDVFFVISGYLITRIIFEETDNQTFSFAGFFGRRARRIFPALILVMITSLTAGWFILLADEYAQLGKHIASGAAFIINFVLVNESGYFDNAAEKKPMLHLWSLAVEEQFYIVWPLMLWLAWKNKINPLAITIIVAIASFALNLKFVNFKPVEAFFWPVGRFWELLSGSVLAWLVLYKKEFLSTVKLRSDKIIARIVYSREVKPDGVAVSNVMSVTGVLMLIYGIFGINEDMAFPGALALVPVTGSLLVIAAGGKAWPNKVLFMNPTAVWFGLISYPLYLWHWPILSFVQVHSGEIPTSAARVMAIILSIIMAGLTYRLVEMRIRHVAKKSAAAVILAVVLAISGVFAYQVYRTSGFPFGKSSLVSEIHSKSSRGSNWRSGVCFLTSRFDNVNLFNSDICLNSSRSKKNILLMGDSHAAHWYQALVDTYPQYNFLQATASGCRGLMPFKGTKRCTGVMKVAFERMKRGDVDAVILGGRWERGDVAKLAVTVNEYEKYVSSIVVFGPTVEYRRSLPGYLMTFASRGRSLNLDEYTRSGRIQLDHLMGKELSESKARFISVIHYLCPSNNCMELLDDNTPTSFDYGHLTYKAARFILESAKRSDDFLEFN